MTEAEWLACKDLWLMMQQLDFRNSDRKLRLFAAACCRQVWDRILDDRSRQAVETSERYADGEATYTQVLLAVAHCEELPFTHADAAVEHAAAVRCATERACAESYFRATRDAATALAERSPGDPESEVDPAAEFRALVAQCDLLREVVGNPFRPVAVEPDWLRWNHGTVPVLARRIYEERAYHDLPILADALEDAGCTDERLLAHCRGAGPHVRGCWAVDLLLGRG